jgi:hypothetical protein
MRDEKIDEVEAECNRLLLRIEEYNTAKEKQKQERAAYQEAHPEARFYTPDLPAHTGAIRRASMDLTRALAKMRRP